MVRKENTNKASELFKIFPCAFASLRLSLSARMELRALEILGDPRLMTKDYRLPSPRHSRNILLNLFDLINDLRSGRSECFGFPEEIFAGPELSFIHHDAAHL